MRSYVAYNKPSSFIPCPFCGILICEQEWDYAKKAWKMTNASDGSEHVCDLKEGKENENEDEKEK